MERRHQPRPDNRLPDRRVVGKFPRSQHRHSLITPPKLKVPAHSDLVKRWNFRKADWKRFFLLTDEAVERLPPPDTSNIERAYQDFCESLLFAAKQCIPRGRRKYYVPCWDKECETIYRSFTRTPVGTDSDRATSSLLSRLGQKKQEQWEAAVNSIDFSHSSREAWRKTCWQVWTLLSPVPHLGKLHRLATCEERGTQDGDRESARLVNKELYDLWKIPTCEGHSISEPFRPEELAAALRCLKPGKSPGLDSIFPEFILHAGSAFKSWFCDFLTSCMLQLKIPKIWRRALIVAIAKPEKPLGNPKSYNVPYLCCVSPSQASRDSSTLVSIQSSTQRFADFKDLVTDFGIFINLFPVIAEEVLQKYQM